MIKLFSLIKVLVLDSNKIIGSMNRKFLELRVPTRMVCRTNDLSDLNLFITETIYISECQISIRSDLNNRALRKMDGNNFTSDSQLFRHPDEFV